MKRRLNLDRTFKRFEGDEYKDENDQIVTLRGILLTYCRNAQLMGLDEKYLNDIYTLGLSVGGAKEADIVITTREYDALKKVVDEAKVKYPDGKSEYLIPQIEIRMQLKEMIDSAEFVEEEKKAKE